MSKEENSLMTELYRTRKVLGIALESLKTIKKRIEDFNDDPMNKIGDVLEKTKQTLKEMEEQ